MGNLARFFKSEDGQTSTEYILLVAVVAMIVFKFKEQATKRLTGLTDTVFGRAENIVGDLQ